MAQVEHHGEVDTVARLYGGQRVGYVEALAATEPPVPVITYKGLVPNLGSERLEDLRQRVECPEVAARLRALFRRQDLADVGQALRESN